MEHVVKILTSPHQVPFFKSGTIGSDMKNKSQRKEAKNFSEETP